MITRLFVIFLLGLTPLPSAELTLLQQTALANQLRKQADLEVDYDIVDGGGVFGIPRSRGEFTKWTEQLPLKDSQKYFTSQKKKKLIVVQVSKGAGSNSKILARHLLRIRDFLVACGYQRVTITQATGFGGTPIHLDHTEPKK